MIAPSQAIDALKEGNQRFLSGQPQANSASSRIAPLEKGQAPFAIILGCADSRVPPELVFDQGLGDLFVVRVAGNIPGPSQIASIDFALRNFGSSLVVVLGHSQCGAIKATAQHLKSPDPATPPHFASLFDLLTPSVSECLQANPDTAIETAVQANARIAVDTLLRNLPYSEERIASGTLSIVAAEYDLASGAVQFLS